MESDKYLGEVSRYIHLNPVRAKLVGRPEHWQWSSYPGYWRKRHEELFMNYEQILKIYATSPRKARRYYRDFMEANGTAEI